MSVRLLCLSAATAVILAGCATSQENPNYKYSTKYKASSPYGTTTTAPSTQSARYVQGSSSNVSYASTSIPITQQTSISAQPGYTRLDHNCLDTESRRQLIGSAVGGTIGAVAGKEFIGGTKGAIIGAAVGGTAGYGIGDKSIHCDPVSVPVSQSTTLTPTAQPYYTRTQYADPSDPTPDYMAPTDRAYGDSSAGTPGYDAVRGSLSAPTYSPTQPQPTYTQPTPPQPVYVQPQPVYVQPPSGYVAPPAMTNISSAQTHPVAAAPGFTTHQVSEGDTVYSMARFLCVGVEDIRRANNLDANFNIKLGEYIQLPTSRC